MQYYHAARPVKNLVSRRMEFLGGKELKMIILKLVLKKGLQKMKSIGAIRSKKIEIKQRKGTDVLIDLTKTDEQLENFC